MRVNLIQTDQYNIDKENLQQKIVLLTVKYHRKNYFY